LAAAAALAASTFLTEMDLMILKRPSTSVKVEVTLTSHEASSSSK